MLPAATATQTIKIMLPGLKSSRGKLLVGARIPGDRGERCGKCLREGRNGEGPPRGETEARAQDMSDEGAYL